MEDQLSEALLDFQLETQNGGSRRRVTHIIYDPDLPPSAPPRLEVWESLKEPIGEGGQGKVLLQTCTSSGPLQNTRRAVKVIRCSDDGGRRRYARELETMVRFSHKKYSRFFATMSGWYFSKDNRDLCIAMDYFPAGDLGTYLRDRQPLSEAHTQEIIGQVLQGLAVMHKAGFAHRDIKPQNILIHQHPESQPSGSWWVKLADFGISKRIDSTITKAHIGTFNYMAPELLNPRIRASDIDYQATDLWAVGVLTFYLLTKAGDFAEWRNNVDSQVSTDDLSLHGRRISSDAMKFIMGAAMWDPTERLTCEQANSHTWAAFRIPKPPEVLQQSASSSPSSSQRSSFSDERELSSLSTRLTDTMTRTEAGPRPPLVQDESILVDRDSSGKVMKQSTTEEHTPRHEDLAASFSRKGKQIATESQLEAYVRDQVNTGQHNSVVQIHSAIVSNPTVSLVKSYTVDECSKEQQDQQQLTKHAERQNPPKNDDLSKAKAQGEPSDELAVREGRQDNFVEYFDSPGHSKPRDSSLARNVALYKFNTRNPQIELAAAIEEDNLPMVQALIDRGISINPASSPFTPLMKAVHVGNLDMVTLLTQRGADVSPAGPYTWTPLTIALAGGHNEIANHLLDLGANVAPLNESNAMSPFDIAACRGDLDMMHRLASLGADINRPDSAQISPLMGAARHGHLEAVKMLINWRADLLAKDKRNRSALQFAAANGHVEIVNLINDEAAKSVFGRVNISNIIPNIEESTYHEVSFPSVLKNYARIIGSYSLGSEKNHRLFAINKRADRINSWGGEACVILQKWALGSNKGEIIAAGQDHLDAGNVLAPLTSIFQVGRIVGRPWRPVSHEVKFLRADLSETQESAVLFRFKISDSFASNLLEVALAHSSNEQAAVLSQFRYLEWREATDPLSKPNVLEGQTFILSLQNGFNPTSVDDRATGSESKDSATVQGKCLATLELTGPWDKSESFVLRIEDHLSPFGYAMVTITALMIWNRYNDKRTSRKYMREVLGHIHKGKKSWFVLPKELDQS